MAVDRRAPEALDEIVTALRLVGEREAHHVVFEPVAESPYYLQFTTDPGIFWGEVVSDRYLSGRARLGARGAERLEALGWRAPAGHIPNWFQYFDPTRKRHYRLLAEHVLATFRDGLRVRGPVEVAMIGTDPPAGGPTFVGNEDGAESCDHELLDLVAAVLQAFEPERFEDHLELTMRRKRHSVRLGVWARAGTISCAALHLPAPEPELLEAAFAVSDQLDRVPYTYALRTVTGHGDSLVLLSKVAVMPEQRVLPVVGLLLYSTIEPLVAAHRELHRGPA